VESPTFDPTGNVNNPTITTPVDIMNPALYASPTTGFFLNRETDKEETARVQLDWAMVEGQAHDVSAKVLAPVLLKFFNQSSFESFSLASITSKPTD
jgi:hypothetical protein